MGNDLTYFLAKSLLFYIILMNYVYMFRKPSKFL